MINPDEILVRGERRLGQYTVTILQLMEYGWQPWALQLDCLVTNYRLMLRPIRKKYEPACLPKRFIKNIQQTTRDGHHCVALQLITDDYLYVMIATGNLNDLTDDLNTMKSPPPRFRFDESIARRDIERLISFFGRNPKVTAES